MTADSNENARYDALQAIVTQIHNIKHRDYGGNRDTPSYKYFLPYLEAAYAFAVECRRLSHKPAHDLEDSYPVDHIRHLAAQYLLAYAPLKKGQFYENPAISRTINADIAKLHKDISSMCYEELIEGYEYANKIFANKSQGQSK